MIWITVLVLCGIGICSFITGVPLIGSIALVLALIGLSIGINYEIYGD